MSSLHCRAFAWLNDCANGDEAELTFVQTQKTQSLYCVHYNESTNTKHVYLVCLHHIRKKSYVFASEVLCHNPPLPSLPDHAFPVLNHDRNDHNTNAKEYIGA